MTDDRVTTPPRPLSDHDARLWATLTHLSALVGIVVGAGFIGWLGPLIVFLIVFSIIAAVAANRGQRYAYPLTIRFIR